jgi:SAM-dependent methyltransferase
MSIVYDYPKYYEIAFSFRNLPHEVDVFEECIRRFAKVPVKTVLELACGNSPHMTELIARSYRYIGLDLNDKMLNYARRKISDPHKALLVKGDMCHFLLNESAEFAFVALGSLYARTTLDLVQHFRSVAQVLPKGGLFLLDACVYFASMHEVEEVWDIEEGEVHIDVRYNGKVVDQVEQLFEETITLEVNEEGRTQKYAGTDQKRIIYPQEFLLLIEHKTEFEFVGWWNDWNMEDPIPSKKPINRPIVLLRKR